MMLVLSPLLRQTPGAIEQSNSGNGMIDMPLASAAMMLLPLYYALKW